MRWLLLTKGSVVLEIGIRRYPNLALHLSQPTDNSGQSTTRRSIPPTPSWIQNGAARVPGHPREIPKPAVWPCKPNRVWHRPGDYGTQASTEYRISYVSMVKYFDPEIKGLFSGKEEKLGMGKEYDDRKASCVKAGYFPILAKPSPFSTPYYGQICWRTSRNNRNAESNLQVLIRTTLIFGRGKSLLSMSSALFRACDQAVGQCGAQTYHVLLVQFDRCPREYAVFQISVHLRACKQFGIFQQLVRSF